MQFPLLQLARRLSVEGVRSYKGILFPRTHFSAPTLEIKYKTSTPSTIDMAMQLLKADPRFVSIDNVCD